MAHPGSQDPQPALPLSLALVATLAGFGALLASQALAPRWISDYGFRVVLIASEVALAAPALLMLAAFGRGALRALAALPAGRVAGLALALGLALWVTSLGLLELQYTLWPPPPGYLEMFRQVHDLLRPKGPLDAVYSLAAIALFPALCEELLMRGVLLPSLRQHLPGAAAIGFSAFAFAMLHFDQYRWPFTFAVGLALGALRLRTGLLVAPVLAHAALNSLTFAAVPFLDDPSEPLPDPRPALGAALFAAGLAATAAAWRFLPPPRKLDAPGTRLS
jgi:membrane protease YdiL (CAAX protease family)